MSIAEKLKPKSVPNDVIENEVKPVSIQANTIERAVEHSRRLARKGFSQAVVRLDSSMEKVLAELKAEYGGASNQVIIVHALLELHGKVC